jgi:hypothetical protein
MGDNATVETIFGLIFLLPYAIGPALVVAVLVAAAPILRRRPVTGNRRAVTIVLSLLGLFWAVQLIGWAWELGTYGVAQTLTLAAAATLSLVQSFRNLSADPS